MITAIMIFSAGAALLHYQRVMNAPRKPRNMTRLSRDAGFTLIELLVVIAVLIALLLPTLSMAKERARIIRCAGNLHQLSLLIMLYAEDNDGELPTYDVGSMKPQRLKPRVSYEYEKYYGMSPATFYCPSHIKFLDRAYQTSLYTKRRSAGTAFITYMPVMNILRLPKTISPRRLPADYEGEADLLLWADWLMNVPGNPELFIANHTSPAGGADWEPIPIVGGNVVPVDGHVEWRRWEDIKLRYDGGGEFVWW